MWVAVVVGGVVGDIGVRSLEADCSGSDVACLHEEVATVLCAHVGWWLGGRVGGWVFGRAGGWLLRGGVDKTRIR